MARALVVTISIAGVAPHLESQAAAPLQQPVAPVRPVTDDYFGTKVVDNYRWMENLKDPEVQQWMRAQADYTQGTLEALPGYRALLARMEELGQPTLEQVSGGVQIVGGRYYSLRTPQGAQSPNLYVREGVHGADRLLIDLEKLSPGTTSHLTIHGYRPSPDGRYVAYELAAGGSERGVLHVYDVQAGKDLPEHADRTGNPFWRDDSRSFFYVREQKLEPGMPKSARDENRRTYLHVLGRSFDDDAPLLGPGVAGTTIAMTAMEGAEIATAPGSRYAIALVSPGTDPRLRVYAAPVESIKVGTTSWRPVAASYDDQYIGGDNGSWFIALRGDTLYWLSRKGAPRGDILKLDLAHADSKPQVVVAQGDLPISAVYAGRDAIYWRVNDAGANSLHRLLLVKGAAPEELTLPYAGDVADVSTDATSGEVSVLIRSYLRSPAYLGIDPQTGALGDDGLQPAGPYHHADDLTVEEVRVKSWDGTLVPLSIVHRKGLALDGNNPTMLQGYGAYGISTSPFYVGLLRPWYDRGGVYAFAHVRGGGELGEGWHHAGFQATKPNSWMDFIACAQYLVDHHYTRPAKLVGFAVSAGGIMIGRAIEERPDLFAAAEISSPAADMLRFQTTANGPGNVPEFGDVRTDSGFKALYAMSPYAHVQDGINYPAVLITTGMNDQRVAAWIPAKFAARLQAATTSGKPVLLRVSYDAGHGIMDATRHQLELGAAERFAFALWQTGDPAFQPAHRR